MSYNAESISLVGAWYEITGINSKYNNLKLGHSEVHFSNFSQIVDYKQDSSNKSSGLHAFKDSGKINHTYLANKKKRERIEKSKAKQAEKRHQKKLLEKKINTKQPDVNDFLNSKKVNKISITNNIKNVLRKIIKF